MLRVGDELITLIDPDAPASEAYRTLRTNILMRNFDRDMKALTLFQRQPRKGRVPVSSIWLWCMPNYKRKS